MFFSVRDNNTRAGEGDMLRDTNCKVNVTEKYMESKMIKEKHDI